MDYDETAFASGLVRGLVEPGIGLGQGCSDRSAAAASPRLDPAAKTAASRLKQTSGIGGRNGDKAGTATDRRAAHAFRAAGPRRGAARMLVLMSKQVFERDPDVLADGEGWVRREFLADACALGLAWRIGRCGVCCRPAPDRHGGYGAR